PAIAQPNPNDTDTRTPSPADATPKSDTLSLHDALPISHEVRQQASHVAGRALRDSALPSLYQVDDLPHRRLEVVQRGERGVAQRDRKSTRLNSSHVKSSYAVFCLHR